VRDRPVAQRLKTAAKNSLALTGDTRTLALEIRFVVERINLLTAQIAQLDKRLGEFLSDQQQLLQPIPGMGDVWAPTILAKVLPVFHPELKQGARKLVAAAGLDVKLRESGRFKGKSKMTKRASEYLRTAMIEAAQSALKQGDPMARTIYDRHKARGKHHYAALSHIAHKMLHVIFSVLKNQRPYTPRAN